MQIRPATPEDAHQLATVHVAAWRAGYRDVMPAEFLDGLTVEQFAARWARWLSTAGDLDPARWGGGRALHDRFAAAVRDLGCTTVRAITSVGNTRSQDVHRRLGFTVSEPVADHDGDGGARVCFARTLTGSADVGVEH